MKWGCPNKMLWPSDFEMNGDRVRRNARYVGHTLERATTGEGGDLWSGWRCQWCGERFQLPGEVARYDLPLMEDVETEELPTEVVEMAAWMLAVVASDDGRGFGHALDILLGNGDRWPEWRIPAVHLAFDAFAAAEAEPFYRDDFSRDFLADINAEAEALIRIGEVKS